MKINFALCIEHISTCSRDF